MEVYDADDHRLHPSDNLAVQFDLGAEYFKVDESTKNGTYHFGTPLKVGSVDVRATLLGVR